MVLCAVQTHTIHTGSDISFPVLQDPIVAKALSYWKGVKQVTCRYLRSHYMYTYCNYVFVQHI
jgi:hypothetical protein